MKYALIMSRDAKRQMDEIAYYIADKTGDIETALGVVEKLDAAAQTLRDLPSRGSIPKSRLLARRGYRMLIVDPYILFYQYDDKQRTVTVAGVIHSRRNYVDLLL